MTQGSESVLGRSNSACNCPAESWKMSCFHFLLLPLNFNAGVSIDIHYSSVLEFLTKCAGDYSAFRES